MAFFLTLKVGCKLSTRSEKLHPTPGICGVPTFSYRWWKDPEPTDQAWMKETAKLLNQTLEEKKPPTPCKITETSGNVDLAVADACSV
jgi:hypothetical protein